MLLKKKRLFSALALMLCSIPAFANHGVDAMGDGLEILFFITLGVAVLTGIAFMIASRNVKRKKLSLRIVSFILSLPLLGLAVLAIDLLPYVGFVFGIIVILLWILIYKSYEPFKEDGTVQ